MKHFFIALLLFLTSFSSLLAFSWMPSGSNSMRYCSWSECGLENGIKLTRDSIDGIEKGRASIYIQEVVLYLLTFITIIAVLYIIYAWVKILTSNGEEEKLKKSKQTIIYVALGISVIWLSWPILRFIFAVLTR